MPPKIIAEGEIETAQHHGLLIPSVPASSRLRNAASLLMSPNVTWHDASATLAPLDEVQVLLHENLLTFLKSTSTISINAEESSASTSIPIDLWSVRASSTPGL